MAKRIPFVLSSLMPLITITNFLMVSFSIPSTSANNATLNTPNGSQPTLKPFSCEWSDLNFSISYGPGIAASLCVLIGGFHIIVGFKYQRITLFATGCSSAALLTYLICLERSSLAVHYVLLITAALGIFGGILCTTVIFCGLFTSGIVAGFSVAITFLFGLASLDVYQSISVPIGVLIVISVVVAGANVWWKRVVLILTSSIYGAALIAGGLDYFVEDLRLLRHVWEKVLLFEITGRLCFFSWITFGVWPLMCLIGLLVQFLKTGKKPSKPKKEFINKHYSAGSPFYCAPEQDDIEMSELLMDQGRAPPTQSIAMDYIPPGSSLLSKED
ncbi:transmembrane protein 198-like [Acropora palmata]